MGNKTEDIEDKDFNASVTRFFGMLFMIALAIVVTLWPTYVIHDLLERFDFPFVVSFKQLYGCIVVLRMALVGLSAAKSEKDDKDDAWVVNKFLDLCKGAAGVALAWGVAILISLIL